MTLELDSNFESDLEAAVLDNVEHRMREEYLPVLEKFIKERLEMYGSRNGYDTEAIAAAIETELNRTAGGVEAIVRLPHPSYLFETGTVAHVVEAQGDGVLSFVWSRDAKTPPPQWVREQFEPVDDGWLVHLPRVEVSGLPEGRFVRDGLNDIRRVLEA